MGFFDRFFKKKEVQVTRREFSLKDIEDFIKKEIVTKNKDIKDVGPLIEEIKNARDDAKEKVEELKNHDFPDEIKDRVYKPILTSKPQYVKSLLESLGTINLEEPGNLDELEEYYKALLNSLKRIQKIQEKKGRIVAMSFEEEVMKLGGALNRIIDIVNEIGEVLEERKADRKTLLDIDSDITELNMGMQQLDKLKDKKLVLKEKISSLKEDIKRMSNEKEEIEKSDAFKKCLDLNECLLKNEENAARVKAGALNILGPLSRTFRKFGKVVDDGKIKFENKDGIKKYIKDPAGAFLSETDGCPVIYEIIAGIEKAIKRGTLSLSPKEKKKVMPKIADIKSGGLEKIKSGLQVLEMEREGIKKELVSLDIQAACDRLAEDIENNTREIEKITAELDSISRQEGMLNEKIQGLKEDIENGVLKIDDTISLNLT